MTWFISSFLSFLLLSWLRWFHIHLPAVYRRQCWQPISFWLAALFLIWLQVRRNKTSAIIQSYAGSFARNIFVCCLQKREIRKRFSTANFSLAAADGWRLQLFTLRIRMYTQTPLPAAGLVCESTVAEAKTHFWSKGKENKCVGENTHSRNDWGRPLRL